MSGSIGCNAVTCRTTEPMTGCFQYPMSGSIGCNFLRSPGTPTPSHCFQYPLSGSIGCNCDGCGAVQRWVLELSVPYERVDWLQQAEYSCHPFPALCSF